MIHMVAIALRSFDVSKEARKEGSKGVKLDKRQSRVCTRGTRRSEERDGKLV